MSKDELLKECSLIDREMSCILAYKQLTPDVRKSWMSLFSKKLELSSVIKEKDTTI